jgi:hypothetical protein
MEYENVYFTQYCAAHIKDYSRARSGTCPTALSLVQVINEYRMRTSWITVFRCEIMTVRRMSATSVK